MNIKISPNKLSSHNYTRSYNNSIKSQHARIFAHFKVCPRLAIIEARNKYGTLHPGGRIRKRRKEGYDIQTNWIYETDFTGITHHLYLYIYNERN
ncbi:helix-turn-helix domain-containing protein [Legionella gresilensis]|uniref:helix-turn-helix domain-containing protein n=1 Tax=Legionella gresilensis TaxID=91823 RepID=UPI003D03F1B5